MILNQGDRVLVIHRRLFENDHSRFFIGTVDDYEGGIARVTGFTFARDIVDGSFCRKSEPRTKLFSLSSGTLLAYYISSDFVMENAQLETRNQGLWLKDGAGFEMDVSEWIHK